MFDWRHAQCNDCGTFTRGPHENEVYEDHNVYAADSERIYTRDEAEAAGIPHNVSGTMCPECYAAKRAKWTAERAEREAARGPVPGHRAELREERRLNREKYTQQVETRRQRKQAEREAKAAERARKGYADRGRKSARRVEGGTEEGAAG